VVVSELAPDVVEAARIFFKPYVHGLFDDPRAVIVAEDGRNYLFGTSEQFDVIVADLFMPWKAGIGSLYSREHYQTARERLREGGLYVQWLPLYQISRQEFGVVARTMRDVFPLVTLWRGTIAPGWETTAVIGHRDAHPLDRQVVLRRLEQTEAIALRQQLSDDSELLAATGANRLALRDVLLQYCGNLTAAGKILDRYPVNGDDRPVVEYEAPITHRRSRANETSWFVGQELLTFLGKLMLAAPPEKDPYLRALSPPELGAVRAGLAFYLAQVLDEAGDRQGAWKAAQEFQHLYTASEPAASGSESEHAQTRRELNQLIEKYQERIRALREHLREAEEEAAASRRPSATAPAPEKRN
jgi:spermidine synthase